ncbi:MAG: Maf family protein [Actinomycetaceae bacterium]|nr:Maf family nucleotide pyrophosphatase [Arcanobacterium sp.]MDD7687157.1 Maf family protein [Actinomycetaceae bacterium]MDY5273900.1 nucleoside triphosphate pyrophosphatase [Arcanobacterium sp.]
MLMVLASASPARRATLSGAHIRHTVRVSSVDEDALIAEARQRVGTLSAQQYVQLLANAKARAVAKQILAEGNSIGASVVVGCDSMFSLGGELVGKPHTEQLARQRLRRMSGHAGELFTGHCVIDLRSGDMREAHGVSHATVFIGEMSDAEINAYIASGEPLEVAGSFTVDGRGGPFVQRIEGDYHGVVGISLPLVRTLLGELGLALTDFWE